MRLRDLRYSLGLPLERLAHDAGLHPTYLGALERGQHTASFWTVVRIAWGAGVDPGSLLAGMRPPPDHPTRPAPT